MTEVDFYNDLDDANVDTIQLNGSGIVLVHKNNDKWHLCKKGGVTVTHACGNGGPINPNKSGYTNDDYYKVRFEKSCELVEPAGALEKNCLCTFCERILEDEFNMERMVVATTESENYDIQRFKNKREEVRDE